MQIQSIQRFSSHLCLPTQLRHLKSWKLSSLSFHLFLFINLLHLLLLIQRLQNYLRRFSYLKNIKYRFYFVRTVRQGIRAVLRPNQQRKKKTFAIKLQKERKVDKNVSGQQASRHLPNQYILKHNDIMKFKKIMKWLDHQRASLCVFVHNFQFRRKYSDKSFVFTNFINQQHQMFLQSHIDSIKPNFIFKSILLLKNLDKIYQFVKKSRKTILIACNQLHSNNMNNQLMKQTYEEIIFLVRTRYLIQYESFVRQMLMELVYQINIIGLLSIIRPILMKLAFFRIFLLINHRYYLWMLKLFICFFINILSIAYSFQLQIESPLRITRRFSQSYTGNLTANEKNLVIRFINESQSIYQGLDFNKIAKYIYTNMQNATTPINMWNTHVFDSKTEEIGINFDSTISNKELFWIGYGKYNLTYVIWVCNICYANGAAGALVEFGENINQSMAAKIKQIVSDSVIYKGDNVGSAADYIQSKLHNTTNAWNILVAKPTTKHGFYDCRFREWWGLLQNYEMFNWTYYMTRTI